jgi:hypothetical protein
VLVPGCQAPPGAAEHQQHGQPITRDALRAQLDVSNHAASGLLRQLRASERGYQSV